MSNGKRLWRLGIYFISLILLTAIGLKLYLKSSPSKDLQPNVFFILIDTLRADHLGCYAYRRNTSPNIDRIAEQGILFSNFYSVSNWTNPAIASLFTGLYPQSVFPQAQHQKAIRLVLPSERDTLAEVVQKAGYKTVALVAHPGLSPKLGFAQGFDEYILLHKKWGKPAAYWPSVETKFVRQEVSEVLDQVEGQRFFIYLHVVYPHQPYTPPPPYNTLFGKGFEQVRPEEKSGVISMYDGEIRNTDELVGRIFDDLKDRGLLKKTCMIITSDHGEAFWEHGYWEHGRSFFDEEIKIPLIVYPPGGLKKGPQKIEAPLSNMDLFPTVAALANANTPEDIEGESLIPFFSSTPPTERQDMLFSESPHCFDIEAMAIISGHTKYIQTPNKSGIHHLLFNLQTDPHERENLAREQQELVQKLTETLRQHKTRNDEKRKTLDSQIGPLDKETIDGLKSLGYLK